MNKLLSYIKNPVNVLTRLSSRGIIYLPDKIYIAIMYKERFGFYPDLDNPKRFTEKLQWLKLNNRKESYTRLVDKFEAKKIISNIIGEKYVIPTLGIYDSFEEINFDKLPEKFVIKTTHDSGGVFICKSKESFDLGLVKKEIKKSLKRNFYLLGREWPYKNVKRRIMIEEYKEDFKTGQLIDYKFFCFDGSVKACFVASERFNQKEAYVTYFDENYNAIDLKATSHPVTPVPPEKPKNFDNMKAISSKLSKGIPFVRVDMYEVNNEIYVGELTFYPDSGWAPFEPDKWDYYFGEQIKL